MKLWRFIYRCLYFWSEKRLKSRNITEFIRKRYSRKSCNVSRFLTPSRYTVEIGFDSGQEFKLDGEV